MCAVDNSFVVSLFVADAQTSKPPFNQQRSPLLLQQRKLDAKRIWKPIQLPCSTYARAKDDDVLPHRVVLQWPEYGFLAPNDVLLTVERCCGCANHDWTTHHDEAQYVQVRYHGL